MRIGTNIGSMIATRTLAISSKALARSLERLASGKRINRAGDDASGLAVATGLEGQIRGNARSILNMNEAKAYLDTAESALASMTDITQRLKELALQAANGALSNQDRGYLSAEFVKLTEELDRIQRTANYNGTALLPEAFEQIKLQVGARKSEHMSISLNPARVKDLFQKEIGTGTFEAATTFTTENMRNIQGIDFDGDHLEDIVSWNGTNMKIYRNTGVGELELAQTISSQLYFLQAADYERDGDVDMFVYDASNRVSILFNDGAGTFTRGQSTTIADSPGSLGDVNGDGFLDMASADGAGTITIRKGNSDGTFGTMTGFTNSFATTGLYTTTLADLTGDGRVELIVNEAANPDLIVFGWNSAGVGSEQYRHQATDYAQKVLVEDFNGDGRPDVAMGYQFGGYDIFLNSGGTLGARTQYVGIGSFTDSDIEQGDLDGDGDIDIVNGSTLEDPYNVWLNNGNGTFRLSSTIAANGTTDNVINFFELIDLDDDGILDLYEAGTSTKNFNTWMKGESRTVTAISDMRLTSQLGAERLLDVIDNGLDEISELRSNIAAFRNRLDYATNSSQLSLENLSAAKSQILDADFAIETAELTRHQILQQAGVSVLGQSNTQMQTALGLLSNLR